LPIYEYRCEHCGASFEMFQKFSDEPIATCQVCGGGPVTKVLHPVAVHFKGSGFYTTDYGRSSAFRTAAREAEGGAEASSSSGSSSSSDSSSSDSSSSSSSKKESGGNGSSPHKAAAERAS
jgi:putative FmdB family regulatory protein